MPSQLKIPDSGIYIVEETKNGSEAIGIPRPFVVPVDVALSLG